MEDLNDIEALAEERGADRMTPGGNWQVDQREGAADAKWDGTMRG